MAIRKIQVRQMAVEKKKMSPVERKKLQNKLEARKLEKLKNLSSRMMKP